MERNSSTQSGAFFTFSFPIVWAEWPEDGSEFEIFHHQIVAN